MVATSSRSIQAWDVQLEEQVLIFSDSVLRPSRMIEMDLSNFIDPESLAVGSRDLPAVAESLVAAGSPVVRHLVDLEILLAGIHLTNR